MKSTISSREADIPGATGFFDGPPLLALKRLLSLARNDIPCSRGIDAGWLVMAAALEPDRWIGAFPRVRPNPS